MSELVPHNDTLRNEQTVGKPIVGRDGAGRFVSGNAGGPGRGKFIDENGKAIGWSDVRTELLKQWNRHGASVLDRLRKRSPLAWARLVLGTLAPKSVDVQLGTGEGAATLVLNFELDRPPDGNGQCETYKAIRMGTPSGNILSGHGVNESGDDLPFGSQGVAGMPDHASANGHATYEKSGTE